MVHWLTNPTASFVRHERKMVPCLNKQLQFSAHFVSSTLLFVSASLRWSQTLYQYILPATNSSCFPVWMYLWQMTVSGQLIVFRSSSLCISSWNSHTETMISLWRKILRQNAVHLINCFPVTLLLNGRSWEGKRKTQVYALRFSLNKITSSPRVCVCARIWAWEKYPKFSSPSHNLWVAVLVTPYNKSTGYCLVSIIADYFPCWLSQ